MSNHEDCFCNNPYHESNSKNNYDTKILQMKKHLDKDAFRRIVDIWDSFNIDEYQKYEDIFEDYTNNLCLDINPDWLLWEKELFN